MLSRKKCKFFYRGFCKRLNRGCKFNHPIEICEEWCDKSGCPKRHPKTCRYGYRCKFGSNCAYFHPFQFRKGEENKSSHVENNVEKEKDCEIERLKSIVKVLEMEVEESKVIVNELKDKITEKDNTISRIKESLVEEEVKNKDLKKAFDDKSTDFEELYEKFNIKVNIIKDIQLSKKESEHVEAQLENDLKHKEDVVKKITNLNSELSEKVTCLQVFSRQQNLEALEKTKKLKEKDDKIDSLETALKHKEEDFKKMFNLNSELNKKVKCLEIIAKQQNSELTKKDGKKVSTSEMIMIKT